MNQFGDLTVDEYRSFILRVGSHFPNETERRGFTSLIFSELTLPPTVDWRTKGYVTPVKNQGKFWNFKFVGSPWFHDRVVFLSIGCQSKKKASTTAIRTTTKTLHKKFLYTNWRSDVIWGGTLRSSIIEEKIASVSQQIKCETKTKRGLVTDVLLLLRQSAFYFAFFSELSLVTNSTRFFTRVAPPDVAWLRCHNLTFVCNFFSC